MSSPARSLSLCCSSWSAAKSSKWSEGSWSPQPWLRSPVRSWLEQPCSPNHRQAGTGLSRRQSSIASSLAPAAIVSHVYSASRAMSSKPTRRVLITSKERHRPAGCGSEWGTLVARGHPGREKPKFQAGRVDGRAAGRPGLARRQVPDRASTRRGPRPSGRRSVRSFGFGGCAAAGFGRG